MITIQTIDLEIKDALVNHNDRLKNLYRSVKAKAAAIAKQEKTEITDEICLRAVKQEIKQLEQTLAAVPEDSDLAIEAKENIAQLENYMPKQLSDEELERAVRGIVMGMSSGSPFGLQMKECMKQLGDRADGKRISKVLKSL